MNPFTKPEGTVYFVRLKNGPDLYVSTSLFLVTTAKLTLSLPYCYSIPWAFNTISFQKEEWSRF
jgi:hypothetical protein